MLKFSVLAIDYDGTMTDRDELGPDVRAAVGLLRSRGIVVVIVTGRRLDDLKRVAGELHFVDAVVAENGAVLNFPASGYTAPLGEPPPACLIEELRRTNIRFDVGASVVEAAAADAQGILAILRTSELPLALVFNRSRVMVLPQAVSKATGLREALTVLRLSRHNSIAMGDAENDYELLRFCEFSAAVASGSAYLKTSADLVLPPGGPQSVAAYLRELSALQQLPRAARSRHRLRLGYSHDGRSLDLAVQGRNVLVAGDPKSGKSWAAGLLCEQLILQGYCVCVVDAEGDYTSLGALPGVVLLGGADPLPRPREIVRTLRHPDVSVVIDLSHTSQAGKREYVQTMLPALATLRRQTGLPHRIVVDEAHYFLAGSSDDHLLDLTLNGYTLVTYRASELRPEVLASSAAIVVTRESSPREVHALFALCASCVETGTEAAWTEVLGTLSIGEAVVLPITSEAEGRMRRIRLAPRLTPHVRHEAKYIDIPVSERQGFVFWSNGVPSAAQPARTLREWVEYVERADPDRLDGHLRRGDFSRWFGEVFGDYPLALSVEALESQYRRGERANVGTELAAAVRQRYRFADP